MSEVVCDIEGLIAKIEQVGDRAHRGVSALMQREGIILRDLARSNAPRDEHDLESAITSEPQPTGINRRTEVYVYVDGSRSKNTGKSVSEYAMYMHEGLAPYGSGAYQLDKGSQEKAGEGHDVGGKFLERAVEERRPIIYYRARQIIKDVTS